MKSFTYVTALSLLACLSNVEVSGIPYYYMENYCNRSFNMGTDATETGRLELTSHSSYQKMTCPLTIVAPSSTKKIMFYFENLDIPCSYDFLELFDGENTKAKSLSGKLCENSKLGGVYTTTKNALTLLFKSKRASGHTGFDAVFTAYHLGACNNNEYDCANGRCIANDLTCNGYNPCGDDSDCHHHLSGGEIAIIVISCFVGVIIIVVIVFVIKRHRRNGNVQDDETTTLKTAT